jgi:hypothetical protein
MTHNLNSEVNAVMRYRSENIHRNVVLASAEYHPSYRQTHLSSEVEKYILSLLQIRK